jgi:hypothetical protein
MPLRVPFSILRRIRINGTRRQLFLRFAWLRHRHALYSPSFLTY